MVNNSYLSFWHYLLFCFVQYSHFFFVSISSHFAHLVRQIYVLGMHIVNMNRVIEAKYKLVFVLTIDTPYLFLTGELWNVYFEDFGEIWPRDNDTAAISVRNAHEPNASLDTWYMYIHSRKILCNDGKHSTDFQCHQLALISARWTVEDISKMGTCIFP